MGPTVAAQRTSESNALWNLRREKSIGECYQRGRGVIEEPSYVGPWYPTLRQKKGEGWGTHFCGALKLAGRGLCDPTLNAKCAFRMGHPFFLGG